MKTRLIATLAMAATAAAVGFAPTAVAAPTGCSYTGGATTCVSPGNAQVTAQPGLAASDAAQLQTPFYGVPFGVILHHKIGRHR
ncbi:hypothetical protein H7J88_20625 [Mycolicibacterium flavescens]|uniref:Keratin associated protein n=1 Tax=Mycolicibacterium flavescens TaxID=1776 RepID=A0A1E3R936_MYCFV|nr:hypothetical protein [Mycolicibacterium flavescens]MCV7282038.1 hypothetical protein [Mycolicibacterium flavescens]ODQ86446.1 hypothetical protein BHQ18_26880 [Mycolicibacterium flavescens]